VSALNRHNKLEITHEAAASQKRISNVSIYTENISISLQEYCLRFSVIVMVVPDRTG
jgi:hypothetical protein